MAMAASQPQPLLVVRKGHELLYFHDRDLAAQYLDFQRSSHAQLDPSAAANDLYENTNKTRLMVAPEGDVLYHLRKASAIPSSSLLKCIRSRGVASDCFRHDNSSTDPKLPEDLRIFLGAAYHTEVVKENKKVASPRPLVSAVRPTGPDPTAPRRQDTDPGEWESAPVPEKEARLPPAPPAAETLRSAAAIPSGSGTPCDPQRLRDHTDS